MRSCEEIRGNPSHETRCEGVRIKDSCLKGCNKVGWKVRGLPRQDLARKVKNQSFIKNPFSAKIQVFFTKVLTGQTYFRLFKNSSSKSSRRRTSRDPRGPSETRGEA